MEDYANTYLITYKMLAQSVVSPEYWEHFDFYRDYPYRVEATISTVHGAALQLIPSEVSRFEAETVDTRIEQAIFKDEELSAGDPMFIAGGTGWSMSDFAVETNEGYFVEVPEGASGLIRDVWVDGVGYEHTIIIKGDNTKEPWSRRNATRDAEKYFRRDLLGAWESSEEFREMLATPELAGICSDIIRRRESGYYDTDFGYWALDGDLRNLYATAESLGVGSEFVQRLYDFREIEEGRPSWANQHPVWIGLFCSVAGALLVLGLQRVWHAVRSSKRRDSRKEHRRSKPKNRKKRR